MPDLSTARTARTPPKPSSIASLATSPTPQATSASAIRPPATRPSADLPTRLRDMLLGWGAVGIVYSLSSAVQGEGVVIPETALDRLIPFDPAGLWLYLSFFVFIPFAYLQADASRLRWLRSSMQVCALGCGTVFLLWPTTLVYPDYSAVLAAGGDGWGARLLALLLWGDSPQNCLPSLHAALTLLCAWALVDARRPWRSAFAIVAAACICFSIIQLRRHLSLDVAAGLLAGLASGALCHALGHAFRHPTGRAWLPPRRTTATPPENLP